MILRNDKLKNNDFLSSLDMKRATKQETLEWLSRMIENEIEKSEDEQDQSLIEECLSYMDELLEDEVFFSEEELQQKLEQIKQAAAEEPQSLPVPSRRRKKAFKVLAGIAASFVVLFSGIAIAAALQGYGSACEFLKHNLEKLTQMNPGDSYTEQQITLIKGGEMTTYPSIEDLIQTEKYDFMTFGYLPENTQIQRVVEEKINDTRIKIFFLFDNTNLHINIYNYQNISEEDLKNHLLHETTNINFYIEKKEDAQYLAIGHFSGYEYQIMYTEYEELLKILDNIKGNIS